MIADQLGNLAAKLLLIFESLFSSLVYVLVTLDTDVHWKYTMAADEMLSVTDESIDVMLGAVFTCRHFEYVRNAQQCLICVTIYNNLPPDKRNHSYHSSTHDTCIV